MIAQEVVRTTGINWESVSAIGAILLILQGLFFWSVQRRERKRDAEQDEVRREISESVNHLSEILLAKLETKETVARISERLARVEGAAGLRNSQ